VKLSVIIVNYNVKYFLEQALYSVRKAIAPLQAEIFVVDNNSADGSSEMVKRLFPEVKLIENKNNPGFSKANNQAIQLAKGEYVLLLNPDTVVPEDCFTKICSFMDETPDAGALGVKMIDGKGNFLPESKRGLPTPAVAFYKMFGLSALFPSSPIFGRYHLGFLPKNEIHQVDVLAGAFMLLRKNVLDKIGLLDEDFFMYGEDIDLSYRITKAGYKNYYYPHTSIIHYKGESTKKGSINYVFVFYKAMIIFAQKHYSQKNARIFSLLINMAIYGRAAVALLFRFVSSTYVAAVDWLLFFVAINLLAPSYARYKFGSAFAYAPDVVSINSIVYATCWLIGLYAMGGYQARLKPSQLAKGVLIGTLSISVFYAFAEDAFRFSRAIIVLGTLLAFAICYLIRLALYSITYKRLNIALSSTVKTIIVGNKQEAERVQQVLLYSKAKSDYLGYVSVQKEEQPGNDYLGNETQLAAIVDLFSVDEIIFCSKDLSTQHIMQWMYTISKPDVHFKIVPESSAFIIGSSSKDEQGDFYTFEINMALHNPKHIRQKRLFDIAFSLVCLSLFPLLLLVVQNRGNFMMNIIKVLLGEKTWVGYNKVSNASLLPRIKPGVLSYGLKEHYDTNNEVTLQKLNVLYAKEYTVEKDIVTAINGCSKLGEL
jgi:O-antigen biosynthesis protein